MPKNKVKKPKEKRVKHPKSANKRVLKKIVLLVLVAFLTFAIAAVGAGVLIYNSQALDIEKLTSGATTIAVYSDSGNPIEDAHEFRPTQIGTVPEHTRWAFICTEDKNFYEHRGFSVPRIAKATFNNITSGYAKEGASTISQQLIKNTHLSNDKTIQRKIREVALAHKLERRFTKQQILEMYFNAIYFGNGIYGLETASRYYFGKPAAGLTVRESASLAGLIRGPAHYCPVANFDNFCNRSDLVLSLMHNQKRITADQFEEAKQQTPQIVAAAVGERIKVGGASYKAAATAEAAKILDLSAADISRYGYKVHTYFDPDIQAHITNTVDAADYGIKTVSGGEADKCILAARTCGQVVGYYASTPTLRGAKRNFASALKPLTVYAPALELGVVTPATMIEDSPYTAGDFNPRNHDGKYHGTITVRQALEQSYNIPAVKVLDYTRLARAADIARSLGVKLSDDENISVALGNTKNGTTFTEMAAGYCTLANKGTKVNPAFIKRIVNKDGKTVYENTKTNTQVLGEDTAFILTDILRTGTKVGTARALGGLPFDIAAKTGTCERTDSGGTNTDVVNCSLTSDFVLVVWAGNADMKPENDLPAGTTGGGVASFIARDIQSLINQNARSFEKPQSVGVCDKTKEYFPLRHKTIHETQTRNFLRPIPPVVDGKLGSSGAPMILFNAQAHQIYEIFKDGVLQEIIKNHSGEYVYTDTRVSKGKTYDYHVVTYLKNSTSNNSPLLRGDKSSPLSGEGVDKKNQQEPALSEVVEKLTSNSVKLYTSRDINKNSPPSKKPNTGKQWFF